MNKIFKIVFVIAISALQGCASNQIDSSSVTMNQLIIAEPLAINYKSEIAIARLTDVIQRAEITDVQRAELYYDRGVIYDSVGLRSLARLDFNRALRLKPDFVDAYNFLGIHYTQLQEFNQAYEAFDSANDLRPGYQFAYLSRGIALYYGGRAQLASQDIDRYLDYAPQDPYRVIWRYIVAAQADQTAALASLKQNALKVPDNEWASNIIKLYLQQLTEEQFLLSINHRLVNVTSHLLSPITNSY